MLLLSLVLFLNIYNFLNIDFGTCSPESSPYLNLFLTEDILESFIT